MTRPAPSIHVEHIGDERQPVIVIDNFVTDPDALAATAAALPYAAMGAYYPGVRAAVPGDQVAAFMVQVAPVIADVFGYAAPVLIESLFSLVTTPPVALQPIQRLPHFDGLEPQRLALLHYLCGPEAGGTAFYRHRSTGFESVDVARYPAFSESLEADIADFGLPPARYIGGGTDIYAQTARFDAAWNRALLYRGHVLHCADLGEAPLIVDDPRAGRLTVNTFLMGGAT